MNNPSRLLTILAFLVAFSFYLTTGFAQGTAFSYQGSLMDSGSPATGNYDFTFTLFNVNSNGTVIAGPITNTATAVTNGLFTTTLDFGPSVFKGTNYWLEIAVETNGGNGFVTLAPRQPVLPVPYAVMANNASNLLGTLPTSQLNGSIPIASVTGTIAPAQVPGSVLVNGANAVNLTGTFSGNGAGLTGMNLFTLNTGGAITGTLKGGTFGLSSNVSFNGVSPYCVVAADVNGDGYVDLITANEGSGSLCVLTNNGSGLFVAETYLYTLDEPYSVTAADVNGDGKVDLIAANYGNATLTIFTNTGHGFFATVGQTVSVGPQPDCVIAADINGDGKVDLISANENLGRSGTLTILTNNGAGIFGSNATLTVGIQPSCVTAADINGDGKLDLISANMENSTLSIWTNNGFGGFGSNTTLSINYYQPAWVVAADVNGDGRPDLITADEDNSSVSVLLNNGSAGFGTASNYTTAYMPYCVAVADVNGDGKPDLISANLGASTVTVLTNNGVGIFGLYATVAAGSQPRNVIAADVNHDGRPDLIIANSSTESLTILTNAALMNATFTGNFTGNGGSLTNLNAATLTGTLPLSTLPAAVITNNQTGITLSGTLSGTFTGDGSGLTNLPAPPAGPTGLTTNVVINGFVYYYTNGLLMNVTSQ